MTFEKDEEYNTSPFYTSVKCLKVSDGCEKHTNVDVIIEQRVELFVNDVHISTFFASPYELEELAAGFLLCEGFLEPDAKMVSIRVEGSSIFCDLDISSCELEELIHIERCGTTSYRKDLIRRICSDAYFSTNIITQVVGKLKELGKIWHITGGAHTSMICNEKGDILFFCEDVGRACSVDKVVGKAFISGTDLSRCALVTTGRLASTMVSKAVNAGIPLIASKGATVKEAVELANVAGISLVAFVRGRDLYIYSGEERILIERQRNV